MSTTPEHAACLLQILAERGLVLSAAGRAGLYILHDLVRAYAADCLRRDEMGSIPKNSGTS